MALCVAEGQDAELVFYLLKVLTWLSCSSRCLQIRMSARSTMEAAPIAAKTYAWDSSASARPAWCWWGSTSARVSDSLGIDLLKNLLCNA